MATQKPISTISYNTEAFLKEKLEDWLKSHLIMAYQYICHKGEDGDKDHIHLRIEPNKRIDPMDLQEQLKEYVRDNKPLGCRPFRPSKEEDWILYAVHDEQYLKIKYGGGERGEKIPYDWADIRAPFDYDTEIAFVRAKATLKHTAPAIIDEIRNGVYIGDLISRGENIFTVNAILTVLQKTDYKRVLADLSKVSKELDGIMDAIDKAGFALDISDNGTYCLVKKSIS